MTASLIEKHGKYYVIIRDGKDFQKWVPTGIPTKGNNANRAKLAKEKIYAEYILKKTYETEEPEPKESEPKVPEPKESEPKESAQSSGCDILFLDCVNEWLEKKKKAVRLITYEGYKSYYDLHIEPYFKPKNLTLKEVTPGVIQEYFDEKGKSLTANSLKKHKVVFIGALNRALLDGYIQQNPAIVAKPKKKGNQFHGKAYSAEQAKRLISVALQSDLSAPITLSLYYGLRRSEVVGIRWCDIDFENDIITICNTVTRLNTLTEQEETKSNASNRTLAIVPENKQYLFKLKAEQKQNKELFGNGYEDNGHVCVYADGKLMKPDHISRGFSKLLERNGLPHIRFHDLRHTAGSLLINSGVPAKQVQEFLGHEKISTTLDIYTHLDTVAKKDTANKIGGILG